MVLILLLELLIQLVVFSLGPFHDIIKLNLKNILWELVIIELFKVVPLPLSLIGSNCFSSLQVHLDVIV